MDNGIANSLQTAIQMKNTELKYCPFASVKLSYHLAYTSTYAPNPISPPTYTPRTIEASNTTPMSHFVPHLFEVSFYSEILGLGLLRQNKNPAGTRRQTEKN
jgi:hypothetical protein